MQRHTDKEYENALGHLRERVLYMGAQVENLLSMAMEAFLRRDPELAIKAMRGDEEIDRSEVEIDEMSLRILARRQPVASDLRFITTTLKLVTDLERIGDLGVNICERVIELSDQPHLPAHAQICRMADIAHGMLRDALDAFVTNDVLKAEQVKERDEIVDAGYTALFPELLAHMTADLNNVERATRLQSIGKYVERIADHATNIAEMVVFMVRGQDVRHHLGATGTGHA